MNTKVEKSILEAFLKLYQDKDLNEIRVKEICSKAGVSRVAFYTYYEDIQSLIAAIEEKALYETTEIFKVWSYIDLTTINKNTPISILVDFFTYIYKNIDMFRALFTVHPNSQFIPRFYELAKQACLDTVNRHNVNTFTPEILADFCVGSFKYIEELWIFDKIKVKPVEFALMVQKVIIAIINCEN
jgi:AcrR family transcriptional regulator